MTLSVNLLATLAIELQQGLTHQDRFQRLITTLRQMLHCDASALLRYEGQQFRPLAIDGLAPDVLGRRFSLDTHPRLEAIARAGDIVRFPADSTLPDPYDGLIPGQQALKVHACVGLPLFAGHNLIGALTLDSMSPHQFDTFSNEELRLVSALAAGALNNALLIEQLESQNLLLPRDSASSAIPEAGMIGLSQGMQALKHEIEIVAASDLNVLISGETGTGKELVARAIHDASPRSARTMVYLNCAALPETVAESELFGHVKGAFTGAIGNRQGKFELADHGTLFLDEIGELSLALQAKLLRVLQYGDIQRVGDDQSLRVDVRVLAATNRDLKSEVLAGRFRADLYHRLSVFPLWVPPLRERGGDIVLLAGYFCEQCRARLGLDSVILSEDAAAHLQQYAWPGNVRELEHAIYRATIVARAAQSGPDVVLSAAHLPLSAAPGPEAPAQQSTPAPALPGGTGAAELSLRDATDAFQRQLIEQALARHQHNWAASARALHLDVANLHRLAKRLGMK
ncbi:nitric oxide reductase transcriptional regulator NorR [Shimwellia blattae]|uniref:Anaerobic nitric oxide reductase transcription regulator NorR n=1 Tax=Shimwellia blattae (strain ATCC 29907 / DSM 4481 / JCM 1650 / NBRC 105725 / CDC 9005-74) TaxID=630626 RepID=I2B814_SHIBC|nr:nitric oxide reductase transcriptional regulator NorR [Shimwellia blattae]AFJ46668.1 anaerobic nitric oxide reductase transcription regulator NorR [Shimwellia blattae DSM 4481 = NBRC 105725]GAB80247.1 anaerobic nitric oxide reductase transcriptional regulator [Shimwellia blattae DSM 4481 = NBRC 105725]VDY64143.1 Anaerobic nitric oxide reductase transcription regulator norR [Shimwellia blattae]VEC22272.1 Anaerobic nitric oxide reductase transcription regulator norR [Shimwellia blattae]